MNSHCSFKKAKQNFEIKFEGQIYQILQIYF